MLSKVKYYDISRMVRKLNGEPKSLEDELELIKQTKVIWDKISIIYKL